MPASSAIHRSITREGNLPGNDWRRGASGNTRWSVRGELLVKGGYLNGEDCER